MQCRQVEPSRHLSKADRRFARRPHRSGLGVLHGSQGVGLIEALAAIAVLAIAAALAAPSMAGLLARDRIAVSANGLLHALNHARVEALRRGEPMTVCRAVDPDAPAPQCERSGNDWSRGWIVVAGDGSAARPPVRRQALDARFASITASAPVGWRITFTPVGQPVGSFAGGSFHICPADHPELGRSVVVSRGARIRVVAETCSG